MRLCVNNVPLPQVNVDVLREQFQSRPSDVAMPQNFINTQPPVVNADWALGLYRPYILDARIKHQSRHTISGGSIYPPNGWMGWHTNGNWPGQRLYASWSENGNSGMLWFVNGQTIADYDKPGWNIRVFNCPVWHAVFSNCWRASVGWHLGESVL